MQVSHWTCLRFLLVLRSRRLPLPLRESLCEVLSLCDWPADPSHVASPVAALLKSDGDAWCRVIERDGFQALSAHKLTGANDHF